MRNQASVAAIGSVHEKDERMLLGKINGEIQFMIISVHQTPRWSSLISSIAASSLGEETHASREVRSIRTPEVQRTVHIINTPGDTSCSCSSSWSTGVASCVQRYQRYRLDQGRLLLFHPGNARLAFHLREVRKVFKPVVLLSLSSSWYYQSKQHHGQEQFETKG